MDLQFSKLTQLSFGYWHAQPLFALTELKVFEHLAEVPADTPGPTASALCIALGIHADAGVALLHAGVALGLLKMRDGRLSNSELASRYLVARSPEGLTHWIKVMGRWSEPWTRLTEAVTRGQPVEPQSLRLGQDPAYLRDFILGMHEYARRSSAEVVAHFGLEECQTLIDVGGGAGTFSVAACERVPNLQVTLLDLPPVLEIAKELVNERGLKDRISLQSHDYRLNPFGSHCDALLFSQVLHQESPAVVLDMLHRARLALRPGGKVLIHGHFLDEDRSSPLFVTLHNLSARVLWEGGGSYTGQELVDLLSQAGFERPLLMPVKASATQVLQAFRPMTDETA